MEKSWSEIKLGSIKVSGTVSWDADDEDGCWTTILTADSVIVKYISKYKTFSIQYEINNTECQQSMKYAIKKV